MKNVKDILELKNDLYVCGLTDDSRLVKEGYIFVATKGYNVDHYDYIDDAIKNGCVLIISDREIKDNYPHIIVDNINDYYIDLCKKFYDVDTKNFKMIGITGTDGKTTTTTIVKRIIESCAYLGTNGLEVFKKKYNTNNTTPCISELYHDLRIIKENKCNTIAMEVSSEALLHNRVNGFCYDIIGFTNITGDHIEVHGSFENYVNSKLKLLDLVKKDGFVIVNGDDNNLKNINCNNLIRFGFNKDNDCIIKNVNYLDKFTIIEILFKNDVISIKSPFIGEYNVYNVVMAFLVCHYYGIDNNIIVEKIESLSNVDGRCEFLDFGQKYDIVLDYAHTINGVSSILKAFSNYDNIIVVTGSAGGRDTEKRRIIGKNVIDNSDIAIFTMDDPRYEDVDEIIDQMVGDEKDYYRIVDREDAIKYALSIAHPGSVVLILGKGRDNYMAIKDKKIHYSDYEVISSYFLK